MKYTKNKLCIKLVFLYTIISRCRSTKHETFHTVPTNVIICVSEAVDIGQGELDLKEAVIRKTKSLAL
jgi:hypothetical protein